MNEERLKELEALCEKATKGPWKWEINPQCKSVRLESSKWCVMSFGRWGMSQATPLFLTEGMMEKAVDLSEIIPGREHHAEWARKLNHPDARFIAEARNAIPDLINRVRELERALEQAVKLGEFEIGKLIAFTNLTTVEECSDDIGQMFITRTDLDSEDWPVSEAPELAKWLQENA